MILNLPRCHDVDIFTGSSSKPGRHMTGRGLLQAAMCHLFWFAADCQYFRAKINSIIFVRGGGAEPSQSYYKCSNHTALPLPPPASRKLHIVNPDQSTSCLDQDHSLCGSGRRVRTTQCFQHRKMCLDLNVSTVSIYRGSS